MYRLKSYTGVAMLPTAFLTSGFHKIELRPSRTRGFTMCSRDPPSLLCFILTSGSLVKYSFVSLVEEV